MSEETPKKRAPLGSRERVAQLGELAAELIHESVALLEHHVPDADERKAGQETRRPASAALEPATRLPWNGTDRCLGPHCTLAVAVPHHHHPL